MRSFVAVYPPPAALEALAGALPPLPAPWRPVPPEQWHLTVAFLGEVPAERLDELGDRLGRAARRTPAATLRLAGGGAFPSRRRAGVLWVGVDGEPAARAALARLADRVAAAARRAGIDVAERRFHPHLTLARNRAPRGVQAGDLVAAMGGICGPPWSASELVLVRSVLGRGAVYEPLRRWPLTG